MNSRIFILIFIVVITFSVKVSSQTQYLTDDEKNIYWQPNTEIKFSDYQATTDTACIKYNVKYGTQMSSSIGIRGVVDVPKKSLIKKGKHDKAYFAPVFCKNCSCILSEDSLGLKSDNLLFDIAEFFARKVRMELSELQKEMKVDNTNQMFFTTVKNKWDNEMQKFFGTIMREVLIARSDSAYQSWRKTIDDGLEQTKKYTTQPSDCYRFVLNEPIEKDYVMAETIVGDLRKKEEL